MSSKRKGRNRGQETDSEAPSFFTDIGLGKRFVEALQREGWSVQAMYERYPSAERRRRDRFQDQNWIPTVTDLGYVILSKDGFRRTHERLAIVECRARVFQIPNANIRTEYMVERFLTQQDDIWTRCSEQGPFLYAVHPTSLVRITLPQL